MASSVKTGEDGNDDRRMASLARRAQTGDLSSFDELYSRTAPGLYAWAALRAPPDIDPGDILGEVWLRAIARLRTHDGGNYAFRAWLFGIAKNVLLQVLRTRRNEPATKKLGSGSMSGLDQVPDSVTSISQRLAREDTIERFLDYARRLDVADRDLLLYCAVEGETCTDAAIRLGLGSEAAAKRWQRLRAELRDKTWVHELLLELD